MKNKGHLIFTFVTFIIVLASCSGWGGKQNIQAYYYPLRELKTPQVYEYRAVGNDSLPPYYWYFQTIKQSGGTFLTGNFYDHDFMVRQLTSERIVKSGALMEQYLLYETDSTGQAQPMTADIEAPNVFPFEVTDSNVIYLFKVKWADWKDSTTTTTLVRNRSFRGFKKYEFKGKEYECAEFAVRDLIDNFEEKKGHIEPQYEGTELYAKGIGLVRTSKQLTPTLQVTYALYDIYEMNKLEEKFREKFKDKIF